MIGKPRGRELFGTHASWLGAYAPLPVPDSSSSLPYICCGGGGGGGNKSRGRRAGLLLSMRHAVSRPNQQLFRRSRCQEPGNRPAPAFCTNHCSMDTFTDSADSSYESVYIMLQKKKNLKEFQSCTVTFIFASELCFPPLPPPPPNPHPQS